MLFPSSALERAMQIKEVLLRAMNKEYSWLRAAEIFCREEVRQVGKDHVVNWGKTVLQIPKQPGRKTCAGLAVIVKQRLDSTWSIHRQTQVLGRYDVEGRPVEAAGPGENRKRPRFPTRTLDAGKRRRRSQLPQAPRRIPDESSLVKNEAVKSLVNDMP